MFVYFVAKIKMKKKNVHQTLFELNLRKIVRIFPHNEDGKFEILKINRRIENK